MTLAIKNALEALAEDHHVSGAHPGADFRGCLSALCLRASRAIRLWEIRGRVERDATLSGIATGMAENLSGDERELYRIAALPITRAEQARQAGFRSENHWRHWLAARGLTGRMGGRGPRKAA